MKKTIPIEEPLMDSLTVLGHQLENALREAHVFSLNIMASPGAGKTTFISKTIIELQKKYRIGVIEGDIVPIDVERLENLGVPVVLAHTGGSCHLDSVMMKSAMSRLDLESIDLLIVENVGNLICPASFYLGTSKNVVIASVPEGDDKPYKYPTMFRGADVIILNKIDYLQHEAFSEKNFLKGVRLVSDNVPVISLSCRSDKGLETWFRWVESEMKNTLHF